MTLAEGYGPRFSKYGWRWFGPREARVLLDIHYTDGEDQQVVSDNSWRWGEGPVREASIYDGETYDARLADNWDEPGYDDSSWQPVKAAAPPAGALEADTTPPIRVLRNASPDRAHRTATRCPRLRPRPQHLRLGPDPCPGPRRNRSPDALRRESAARRRPSTRRRTATPPRPTPSSSPGSEEPETFEPEFTYHGFRYVEVTGLPGGFEPTLDTLDGRVVHADLPPTAGFESSDPLLDRIYAANRRTMENNAMSYPTDNPVRDERTGPGMDVQAYVDAAVRDFDADRYLAGFLDQLDEEWGGSPDMNLAHIPIAWALYEQYGDLATLAGSYASMSAALDNYMSETAATGGVWPEPDTRRTRWLRRLVPADPSGRGRRRRRRPRRRRLRRMLQRGIAGQHGARLPRRAHRRRGGAGARARRRRLALRRRSRSDPGSVRGRVRRRRRRLRQRTAGDEHPPAGLRHGAGGPAGAGRRCTGRPGARTRRRPPRHRHLRHPLPDRRARRRRQAGRRS